MARISTYPTSVPVGTDLLIGTKDPTSLETKNFSVQSILDMPIVLVSPDGTSYSLSVSNAGVLIATAV